MGRIFKLVSGLAGLFLSVATLVSLAKNGLSIELHSIPKELYESYAIVRDRIFWSIEELTLRWWTEFEIPRSIRDIMLFYLFFGLALERARSDEILAWIFKHLLRGGTLRFGEDGAGFSLSRLLITVLIWPYALWKTAQGWREYGKQEVSSSISNEGQMRAKRIQYKIKLAGLLSYPITLLVSIMGACVYFIWNFLQGRTASLG